MITSSKPLELSRLSSNRWPTKCLLCLGLGKSLYSRGELIGLEKFLALTVSLSKSLNFKMTGYKKVTRITKNTSTTAWEKMSSM